MLQVLDARAVRQWCAAGLDALRAARDEIDGLNVYPVPDGDTGTNLVLTLEAVSQALAAAGPSMAETARAVSDGALLGARGNSGVIVSQLLRGLCEGLTEQGAGPQELRAGLCRAADLAYAAVAAPVEGTVLSVARRAAEGAQGADLAAVVRSAREAADEALARTPEQLPALRDAGVVDAGGRGLCVLLQALEQVVTGSPPCAPVPPAPLVARNRAGQPVVREAGSPAFAYEVQFLLRDTDEQAVQGLSTALSGLGDSLVVVGGGAGSEALFNVHVHVNDVGAAVEAAVEAGRPFRISVARFSDERAAPDGVGPAAPAGRAVVAVARGAGLAELFQSSGAHVVAGASAGADPSTAEVLAAVRRTGAREVLVLPNDVNVVGVARAAAQAAQADGLTVVVVPTRAVVQGLAALAVTDDAQPLAETAARMREAAEGTRWAGVTTAVRSAATAAGPCRQGDALGLLGGTVVTVGADVEQVAAHLLERLLVPGAELVTVLAGADAPPGAAQRVAARARAAGAEVTVHCGGQPRWPLLLGAE